MGVEVQGQVSRKRWREGGREREGEREEEIVGRG